NLVNYLLKRSRIRTSLLDSINDLNESITTSRELIKIMPLTDENRALDLQNLASGLIQRYEKTSSREDIDDAVSVSYETITCTPVDHPKRAGRASTLAK